MHTYIHTHTSTHTHIEVLKDSRRTTYRVLCSMQKQSFIVKRRCKQILLETFYNVTNTLTLYLDYLDEKKQHGRPLRTVMVFTETIFYNRFGKNILNKPLQWYVSVICKIELIIMSTLHDYSCLTPVIEQILCRENDMIFPLRHNMHFFEAGE